MGDRDRILILFSELGAHGGIQRFNRTLLAACERLRVRCDVQCLVDTPEVLARVEFGADITLRGHARNKVGFATAVLGAVLSGHYRLIVVGHIHLLGLIALAARVRRIPSVLVAHGIEVWDRVGLARRIALRAAARVLCVSEYTRQSMYQQARSIDAARFVVFPNALSESWVRRQAVAQAELGTVSVSTPARFVLSVARLTPHDRAKGILAVIEALPLLPATLRYVIAGNGPDMEFLRAAARRLAVHERVHFVGSVSDAQLADLYRRCAAFVLPSSKEGFGIVFLEAMYFGAAVIAAREKGATDVVRHEETGLLVPYNDVPAIAAAIARVLADDDLRERLRHRGRAAVTNGGAFAFDAFVTRTAAMLGVAS